MPSHDHAYRRRAKRSGRERGCWAYIQGEDLERMGFKPGDAIYFRTWADPKRPRVIVNLYREA